MISPRDRGAVLLDRDGDGRFEAVEEWVRGLADGMAWPPRFSYTPMAADRTVVVRGSFRAEVVVRDAAGEPLGRATLPFDRHIPVALSRPLALGERVTLTDSLGRSVGALVEPPRTTLFWGNHHYFASAGGTLKLYGREWPKGIAARFDGEPVAVEWIDPFRLRLQVPARPNGRDPYASYAVTLTGPGLKEPIRLTVGYWSR